MKPSIRMIAIDLDGTLLNSEKRISEGDLAALQTAFDRGIEIVPVTGRNFSFALPVVETLPFEVPLVTTNGAVIRSRNGETYMRQLLGAPTALEILQATPEFRAFTVVVYDQAGPGHLRIQRGIGEPTAEAKTLSGGVANSTWLKKNEALVARYDSLASALDGDPLEILFTGPMEVINEIIRRLGNGSNGDSSDGIDFRLLRTEYPKRDFAILDAIHGTCSKGHALEHWSRLRGIAPEEIMAIGDNYNDLEMLRFAGFPVVMGNADAVLKSNGWPVTLDCDSSGVAHAVREYAL
jgi:HAD superfamily hydrolase (TIGR01484 family)